MERCRSTPGQFISNIFLADKPNGEKRFILNLKQLNTFVCAPHFKMEDSRTASRLIQKGMFLATIDLKDAYYSVPINTKHRKYLRFFFKNALYEFTCLPFGLTSAPLAFSKLLRPVVEFLRCREVTCVNYLDDFFLLGLTREECSKNIQLTISVLESLGFLLNREKSVLSPNVRCKFLGFIFDSVHMTIELPPEKREKILKAISEILTRKSVKILTFAKFLGLLTSACPAVKYGWLYTKLLERAKYLALQSNHEDYNSKMFISRELIDDINWWKLKIPTAKNAIKKDTFDLEIFTDASLSGWGAFCQGHSAHGWWKSPDTNKHINLLELQAIHCGLKYFGSHLKDCNILIRTDNTTALSYINRMGSVKFTDLNVLARSIWQWCENKNIWVFASYIPSDNNWQADRASRILPIETEWSLNDEIFALITTHFGTPEIDLFASIDNRKCVRYISWLADPEAETIDAFTVSWTNFKFYAFPPFSLILRTLQKIVTDQATGILVVPLWKSQPWYPLFIKLLVGDLLFFGPDPNILLCPYRQEKHPLVKDLTLAVAKLSGRRFDQLVSPKTP